MVGLLALPLGAVADKWFLVVRLLVARLPSSLISAMPSWTTIRKLILIHTSIRWDFEDWVSLQSRQQLYQSCAIAARQTTILFPLGQKVVIWIQIMYTGNRVPDMAAPLKELSFRETLIWRFLFQETSGFFLLFKRKLKIPGYLSRNLI